MVNRFTRLAFQLLMFALSIGSADQTRAGTLVTVAYSGTGTPTGGTSKIAFTGTFTYDSGQGGTSSGGWWQFPFKSASGKQAITYQLQGQQKQTGTGATALPFTIWTQGSTFKLVATAPQSPKTTVSITLPTFVPLPTTGVLPLCENSNDVAYFQSSVLSSSTSFFTLSVNSAVTFSGTINVITGCTPMAVQAPPAPPILQVYYVSCQQPRPVCCLSRLFCQGCFRRGCR